MSRNTFDALAKHAAELMDTHEDRYAALVIRHSEAKAKALQAEAEARNLELQVAKAKGAPARLKKAIDNYMAMNGMSCPHCLADGLSDAEMSEVDYTHHIRTYRCPIGHIVEASTGY